MQVDSELIARCWANDRRAHKQLYEIVYGFMMTICLRYRANREDARSSVNNAFLKVVTNLDKFKSEVPFAAWLSRITLNSVIDEYRRDKNRREHMLSTDFSERAPSGGQSGNEAALQMDAEALLVLIQQLPPTSQLVFNLFAIEGFSHQEISNQLGMSEGTSKWHVSFARKTLQDAIAKSQKPALSKAI